MEKGDEVPPSYEQSGAGNNSSTGAWNPSYPGNMGGTATSMPPPQSSPYGQPPYGQSPAGYQYTTSNAGMYNNASGMATVISQQPMMSTAIVNVPDHMTMAVLVTCFCCLPLGICAVMKASESRDALMRNDVQSAMRLSQDARRLSFYGIAGGVATYVVLIILLIVLFTVVLNTTYYY